MKSIFKFAMAILVFSILIIQLSTTFAQGDLTPPGPPEPLMKSLAQVEPRTPISEPLTITLPGSYYLVTDLTVASGDAIVIAADGVTLDLNGFTIHSSATTPEGRGIHLMDDRRNISILNGFIEGGVTNNAGTYEGGGFGDGIYSDATNAVENVLVLNLSVSGCQHNGIHLGLSNASIVESCLVHTAGNYGIYASSIKNSIALDCGNNAIYGGEVSGCRGESGIGSGVSASSALNCYGYSESGQGIAAFTAQNCVGSSDGGDGLYVYIAQGCYGYSVDANGIYAEVIAIGCLGYSANGLGLDAIIANSCLGDTTSGTAENITHKYNMP